MVVDFVVGRVLTQDGGQEVVSGLDDVSTYYLLHRHDFGMDEAPVGGCILYALSCNLSDSALVSQHDLLARAGKGNTDDVLEEDLSASSMDDEVEEMSDGGGAKVKLKNLAATAGSQPWSASTRWRARATDRPGTQTDAPLARRGASESRRLHRHAGFAT